MQVCVCLTNGGYFMILQNEAYSTDERNKMAIQIMKKQSWICFIRNVSWFLKKGEHELVRISQVIGNLTWFILVLIYAKV